MSMFSVADSRREEEEEEEEEEEGSLGLTTGGSVGGVVTRGRASDFHGHRIIFLGLSSGLLGGAGGGGRSGSLEEEEEVGPLEESFEVSRFKCVVEELG
jgi:hypothetical protein